MHKSKFRLPKQAVALFGLFFFLALMPLKMLFGAENLTSLDFILQSCENSALSIQKSNDEILKSMNQFDEGIDGVRIRIRRSHSPRHP